jgi:Ca2+-binding EF-hand superfamily protein
MATMNSKKLLKKEQLIKAFNYFDVDNNGSIDKNDIKNALLRNGKKIINEDEIEKIIKEVDKNGKITISNFLKLFGFEE